MKRRILSLLLAFVVTISIIPIISSPVNADDNTFLPLWPTPGEKTINTLDHYSWGDDHTGIDVAVSIGTQVLAVADGVVKEAYYDCPHVSVGRTDSCGKGYGNYVLIEHYVNGKTYTSLYGHLKQYTITVSVGQAVTAGQVIGLSGSSGKSSGPHLHFEVYEGTRWSISRAQRAIRSFQTFQNRYDVLDSMVFNFNPNNSYYFKDWIINNCTKISNTRYVYSGPVIPTEPPTVTASGKEFAVGSEVTFSFNAPKATSVHLELYKDGEMYFNGEFNPTQTYSRYLTATGHYAFYIVAHYPGGDMGSNWDDFNVYNDLSEFIPAKPDLWASTYKITRGDTIEIFHWSERASFYSVSIYKEKTLLSNNYYYTSSENVTFDEAGTFLIVASAVNAYGESEYAYLTLVVDSGIPATPELWITNSIVYPGDEIEVHQWSELASFYSVTLYKNGEFVFNKYFYTGFETIVIETEGSYIIAASAVNSYGESGYSVVTFDVYAPHTTHTYELISTVPATCNEDGSKTYTCSKCGDTYTETVPATGHTPASAVKENEVAPTCETTGSYDEVIYCSVCHTEISRERKLIPCLYDSITVVVESKKTITGKEFSVSVDVKNNPGFSYLEMTPVFSDALTLVSVENGDLVSDFTKDKQYVWVADEDVTADGTLLTFTFSTPEDVELGEYRVGFVVRSCVNYDEEMVSVYVEPGVIDVVDYAYGDANGDGVINGQDVVRLKKYLANYDYDTGTSTAEIGAGADANGDGVINGQDVVRLKKYLANYDYETGTSTIALGA